MKLELSRVELTQILIKVGIIDETQTVEVIRRGQYRGSGSIVLFIDYKKKEGGK